MFQVVSDLLRYQNFEKWFRVSSCWVCFEFVTNDLESILLHSKSTLTQKAFQRSRLYLEEQGDFSKTFLE